jgi:uncharacterized membrane protein YphA (DoxX/SURF4 family)
VNAVPLLLHLLLRLGLGAYFVHAAWGKLLRPDLFAEAIRGYDLLADPWVTWVALGLPWLEVLCGLGLALGLAWRACCLWIACCLMVFVLALVSAWWRGLEISCGCLGQAASAVGAAALLRQALVDVIGLAAALWLVWSPPFKSSDEP